MKYLDYSQAEMIEIGITDLFCDFHLMFGVEKNYVELQYNMIHIYNI